MPKYMVSPELEALGAEIVAKHHTELGMINIGFLFHDVAPRSDRADILFGKAVRVDDRNWILHKRDALVVIEKDSWDLLSPDFQRLVLDHELCHIELSLNPDGTVVMDEATLRPRITIRHHSIEEFDEIIERHGGTWSDFRKFARQLIRERQGVAKASTLDALAATNNAAVAQTAAV